MVWLLGNEGMLGSELALHLGAAGIDFIGTDRDVDITDFDALNNFAHAQKEKISFIINWSAYTAVDKAEYCARGKNYRRKDDSYFYGLCF